MTVSFFITFFGRTDLRTGASKAKFDSESDFEVCFAVDPPKPGKNYEKLIFRSEKFAEKKTFPQC